MADILLQRRLKNLINKINPDNNYEFSLKTISVNGVKKGCSGFIKNNDNGVCLYVSTETNPIINNEFLYRYCKDTKDFRGFQNNFAKGQEEFAKKIVSYSNNIEQYIAEYNRKYPSSPFAKRVWSRTQDKEQKMPSAKDRARAVAGGNRASAKEREER